MLLSTKERETDESPVAYHAPLRQELIDDNTGHVNVIVCAADYKAVVRSRGSHQHVASRYTMRSRGQPVVPLRMSGRKTITEHWKTANGFCLGRLVPKNVPVLGELAVFETQDVGGDP